MRRRFRRLLHRWTHYHYPDELDETGKGVICFCRSVRWCLYHNAYCDADPLSYPEVQDAIMADGDLYQSMHEAEAQLREAHLAT